MVNSFDCVSCVIFKIRSQLLQIEQPALHTQSPNHTPHVNVIDAPQITRRGVL
jgi:hypothetical protein